MSDNDHETRQIEDDIARNLQRAFRERAEEDVPDRFLDLIAQLRAQDGAHEPASGGSAKHPRAKDDQ